MRFADAHRRSQVRRLHKDRIAERPLDLCDGLARVLFPIGAEQRDVFDDGQAGFDEEAFHHVLVHARGRAQHAGADVGDAGQLEEPLDGAVLAEGAVQHGKDDIEDCLGLHGPCGPGSGASSVGMPSWRSFAPGRGFGVAGAQPPRSRAHVAVEQLVGVCRGQPAALPGDADGGYVELVAVDGPQNRCGRQQRDLMLAAAPAKKNAYAKFFCHFLFDRRVTISGTSFLV